MKNIKNNPRELYYVVSALGLVSAVSAKQLPQLTTWRPARTLPGR